MSGSLPPLVPHGEGTERRNKEGVQKGGERKERPHEVERIERQRGQREMTTVRHKASARMWRDGPLSLLYPQIKRQAARVGTL